MAVAPTGRAAVVTGGATGVGRATVLAFARSGLDVIIGYFQSHEAAAVLTEEVTAMGRRALPVHADVTEDDDATGLVHAAIAAFGRLDVLINNAGGAFLRGPLGTLPRAVWEKTLALNLTGPYLCCRAAIPYLVRQQGAAIVNVASSSAFTGGSGGSVHYAAAKAGLIALTKGLARELGPEGVRVNCVAPAAVDTDFHKKIPPASPLASWPAKIPLGRLATPQDVASAIVFLASDAASFVSGETFHINGGMLVT